MNFIDKLDKDLKDLNIKIFLIGFLKYFLIGSLLSLTLFLFHRPPIYYPHSFIDYIFYAWDRDNIKVVIYWVFWWGFVLTPLLYLFKTKYVGNIFLALFSFWVGTEMYFFYLEGGAMAWNIGINQLMIENIVKAFMNPTLLSSAGTQYAGSDLFYKYMILVPIAVFIYTYLLLKLLPKGKFNIIGLFFILFFLSMVPIFQETPYFLRVMYEFERYAIEHVKENILNYHREDIYVKDINLSFKKPKNIIFVMDESVRGDYVSFNSKDPDIKKATPFLQKLVDSNKMKTFGVTYSMGNCSDPSNTFFLDGGKNNYLTAPTIFQYMKYAGYKTIRLDAPHTGYFNGVKRYDSKYIDTYISTETTMPRYERDLKAIEELKKIIQTKGDNFIYFTKHGVHFPFKLTSPEGYDIFKDSPKENSQKWFKEEYLNGLSWSVDHFWKELVKATKGTDTVIYWLSDHGVNVGPDKGNNNIRLTHCETGMNHYKSLYNVVSALYSENEDYLSEFKNLNESSAISAFPTLLYFAGFENYSSIYTNDYRNPSKEYYPALNFSYVDKGLLNIKNINDLNITYNREDFGINKRKESNLY